MSKREEIMAVLNKYNHSKFSVQLQSVKDCTEFWSDFVREVYYKLPETVIRDATGNYLYRQDSKIRELLHSFAESDNLEVVNRKGKLLKRFSLYYKQNTEQKLDDSTLGIIGDVLQYFLTKQAESNNTYIADFTDVIDWKDGMFGKSGSCWWGTYEDSQDVFIGNGGWGIRFYDSMEDRSGIGRTWIVPCNGYILGFNFYGYERPKVSKIMKAIFAQNGITLHYKQTRVYNSYSDTIPYINDSDNNSGGFVLYMEGIEPQDEYDLQMEESRHSRYHCTHCHTSIDIESGNYEYINDDYYCYNCVNELFSSCDRCGEWFDGSDVQHVKSGFNYEYLCEYCAKKEELTQCCECKEYTDETVTDHNGDDFCTECAESHLHYCKHCEEYYYENQYDNHDCPLNRDYSGLVEYQNYTLHAELKVNPNKEHITTVYKIDGCNGLALYDCHLVNSNMSGWNICHETSGLALKSNMTFNAAKKLLQRVAFLTDWTKSAQELSDNRDLMNKVYR